MTTWILPNRFHGNTTALNALPRFYLSADIPQQILLTGANIFKPVGSNMPFLRYFLLSCIKIKSVTEAWLVDYYPTVYQLQQLFITEWRERCYFWRSSIIGKDMVLATWHQPGISLEGLGKIMRPSGVIVCWGGNSNLTFPDTSK